MVGKSSPRFNRIASGSPRLRGFLPTASGIKSGKAKKTGASPNSGKAKKNGASPRVLKKQRADWTPALEKSLVDILLDYKDSGYRGDNGCWSSEGWNKVVKEFHLRNKYISYTKNQIQDKEGQLKRDYKMLKEARRQSGASWNEDRNMVQGSPSLWSKLEVSYPKIKKFNNNKARFPLFDTLGELYDGHLAEGTYNVTTLESTREEEPLQQIQDLEDDEEDLQEIHELPDDDYDAGNEIVAAERSGQRGVLSRDEADSEVTAIGRSEQQRTNTTTSTNKQEKETKRPRKGAKLEDMMGRYLEIKTKQVEDEAREKEAAEVNDFSIKRCISVLSTLDVSRQEKAKAMAVFIKSKENRETFICGCEEDAESTLIWLRSEMV